MEWFEEVKKYVPKNDQELLDRQVIMDFSKNHNDTVLLRNNQIAHFTSSAFILNEKRDKVLMVYHKLRNTWAWPGGHADGNGDLFTVAQKETWEETGIVNLHPLSKQIASLDILLMEGHIKNGTYVNPHLHFSAAYLFEAKEALSLRSRSDKNTSVGWVSISKIHTDNFSQTDVLLYQKLISRVNEI